MGTQKEFDDLMREKLEGFEADPPARIWAAVQAEVASPTSERRRIGAWWFLGVAAAVAMLATAMWLFWPANTSEVKTNEMADKEVPVTHPQPSIVPMDSGTQQDTPPAPAVEDVRQKAPAPKPSQPGQFAEAPKPSPQQEAPLQVEEQPREEIEWIAKDEPMPILEEQQPMQQPFEGQPKALPTYAELASNRVSKGVLGAVTTGAREMLGIDTHYYEEQTASAKTTTFTADLKFIKVTRTRKVKTGPS